MNREKLSRKVNIWLFWNYPFICAIISGFSFFLVSVNGSHPEAVAANLLAGVLNLAVSFWTMSSWSNADKILGKDWRKV